MVADILLATNGLILKGTKTLQQLQFNPLTHFKGCQNPPTCKASHINDTPEFPSALVSIIS